MGKNEFIDEVVFDRERNAHNPPEKVVREEHEKPIRVDPEYKMPKVRIKEMDRVTKEFKCCMCGTVYNKQQGNFYSGGTSELWKGNNGFVPICKSCCEKYMAALTHALSGNEEHALQRMCALFDWYYCEAASVMALASTRTDRSRLSLYPSKMCIRQVSLKGQTYLDTLRDNQEESEKIYDVPAEVCDCNDAVNFVVTPSMVRKWGRGFTPEQYQYLEEEYTDWVTKNVCNTKTQEELYKNIALSQLDLRIARQKGGNVNACQDSLQKLMNAANILPKQTADNIIADTQTFGTLLKKFEDTDPIPEPDEEWKDVDGVRKYFNTWVRGGLAKALKITNDNSKLYEESLEEYEKYTVRPAVNVRDEDAKDASIFDVQDGGKIDDTTGGDGDE